MEIQVIEICFHALGKSHRVYDLKMKALSEYEQEVGKIQPLAYITTIENKVVTLQEYRQHSYRILQKWNLELEQRFNHLDNELL